MVVASAEDAERLLRERRARGLDRFDEVWNGELHRNPPPRFDHQRVTTQLAVALDPLAKAAGLEVAVEAGLFDPVKGEQDYRQPDLLVVRPEHITERGVEGGCELVVEVRSPRDETYLKFDFYAAQQVREILVIEPATRVAELYRLTGDRYRLVDTDDDGGLTLGCLPATVLTSQDGDRPVLIVQTPHGESSF